MQVIPGGPDIPYRLLHEHEAGRVVFFCGAGISMPAGLPGFGELTRQLFTKVGAPPNEAEQSWIEHGDGLDRAIGSLERRVQGGRQHVRKALPSLLTPDTDRPGALTTHYALLRLARTRTNRVRLVTTNFDTLFGTAAADYNVGGLTTFPDPPPRRDWDGIVHLHGRLPSSPGPMDLDALVLSDADFGRAYLTEGWAARFVTTLMREFTICFVGYSIEDPVLRYMTAAQILSDDRPALYAFAPYSGDPSTASALWEAKHVRPILYEDGRRHRGLHRTLQVWASVYRHWTRGKERIAIRYGRRDPRRSSPKNDFAGRVLWALADPSGSPARRFAAIEPPPSLDRLDVLSQERFVREDLAWMLPSRNSRKDRDLTFSLLLRPVSGDSRVWTSLVSATPLEPLADEVGHGIVRWLLKHLWNPHLLAWLGRQGGRLNPAFGWEVARELGRLAIGERPDDSGDSRQTESGTASFDPRGELTAFWRLMLAGRVVRSGDDAGLYSWASRLEHEGWTAARRIELRELLSPCISIEGVNDVPDGGAGVPLTRSSAGMLHWKLVLRSDGVHAALRSLETNPNWRRGLADLTEDFLQLLTDATTILSELSRYGGYRERSYYGLPSIEPHWQNRGTVEWVVLMELVRDAWLETKKVNPSKARGLAQDWIKRPYPAFRRLALYTCTHEDIAAGDECADMLLSDDGRWLWAAETKREVIRVLVQRGRDMGAHARGRLEAAILAEPSTARSSHGESAEAVRDVLDRARWLRLAKLASSGVQLGAEAQHEFERLTAGQPAWALAEDQSDEFSSWIVGTGDPGSMPWHRVYKCPRRRRALASWLKERPAPDGLFEADDWREVCTTRCFQALFALQDLAAQDVWPEDRWIDALDAWSHESKVERTRRVLVPLLGKMPESVFQDCLRSVAVWLKAASRSVAIGGEAEGTFVALCDRVLATPNAEEVSSDDAAFAASNHPVGAIVQVILQRWFDTRPMAGQGLPDGLRSRFSTLLRSGQPGAQAGRVILAMNATDLWHTDLAWAESELLPLFDWARDPEEARRLWMGLLSSRRVHGPLIGALRSSFAETAHHYNELRNEKRHYAGFVVTLGVGDDKSVSRSDLRRILEALPQEALNEAAEILPASLSEEGKSAGDFWDSKVRPFWHEAWPKDRTRVSESISRSVARTVVAAAERFPDALEVLGPWLAPMDFPASILRSLEHAGLTLRFPEAALNFVGSIVDESTHPSDGLAVVLDQIAKSMPDIRDDHAFLRLEELRCRWG